MNHNLMGNSNERSYKKRFPLHDAVLHDNVESVKLLLEKGANIDTLNDDGETPIHMLCSLSYPQYNLEMIELLLEKGANTEVCACRNTRRHSYHPSYKCKCDDDEHADGPLNLACNFGNLELCKLLLKNGANVNSKGEDDNTPLHELFIHCGGGCNVKFGDRLKILNLLLESGANLKALNDDCKIPLDYANMEVVKILEEHIAQRMLRRFFRIISAKNISTRLRSEPDNLFDPEFSDMRKRILKIDDSCFTP